MQTQGAQRFARAGVRQNCATSCGRPTTGSLRDYRAVTILASSVQFFSFFFSGVAECIPLRSMHTATHLLFKQ